MIKQLLLGLHILVADDDYVIADHTCRSLVSAGGVICGPVATVDDALRALDTGRVDAAFVKVSLRDGPAGPLLDEIVRRQLPYVLAASPLAVSASVIAADVILLPTTGSEAVKALRSAVDARR